MVPLRNLATSGFEAGSSILTEEDDAAAYSYDGDADSDCSLRCRFRLLIALPPLLTA